MAMSPREVVDAWFNEVWNDGNEATIDRLMMPEAVYHGLPAPVVGPAQFKPFFRAFRQAFPDIRVQVLQTICEGDTIACRCAVTGTHRGPGMGEATGRPIRFEGMAMAVIRDGRIHEGWNSFDFMTMYQQIGLLPALPA